MKPTLLFLGLSLALTTQASWWGSSDPEPSYNTWSTEELTTWLKDHKIPGADRQLSQPELKELVRSHWDLATVSTYDQYASAQRVFADVRDTSFEKWDESSLREFLLEQGIVAPKGPKEELVQLARSRYKAYTDAASSFSSHASTAYTDATHQHTKALSGMASCVTDTVARTLDDAKDYVYSTWDDNKLCEYLESKGVQVKEQAQKSRNDLLGMMRDAYAKVTQPVWEAWSDSYLHEWLVAHNILSLVPPSPYSREYLLDKMAEYYCEANKTVYSTWSESQMRDWLVQQGIIKPEARLRRDELLKRIESNYCAAKSTFLDIWSDSQMRDWLVEHKYLDDRTAGQKQRGELAELIKQRYMDTAPYLACGEREAEQKAKIAEHGAKRKYTEVEEVYGTAKERAYEKGQEATECVGDKVKCAGEGIKGKKVTDEL